MAYDNYLLKIDGTAYSNSYLVIPSYKVNDEPIIVQDYYDTNYDRHIIRAPKDTVTIEFRIRQLTASNFALAIAPLSDTMTVEYYDPKTDSYLSGTFTYDGSLNPTLDKGWATNTYMQELQIKLLRKKAST